MRASINKAANEGNAYWRKWLSEKYGIKWFTEKEIEEYEMQSRR